MFSKQHLVQRSDYPASGRSVVRDIPVVAIVGAGPYGLSIAAHLRAAGIDFRIFGTPMQTWRERMPKGMLLKSDGFASNLSDPESLLTLGRYCAERGIPYDDTRIPIPLDTFTAYGLRFQKQFVPDLEEKQVSAIDRTPDGFALRLDTGETALARNVILAVGIAHFQHVPPELAGLPPEFLTHSSAHGATEQFRGKDVTIIGSGASAADLAACLHESGANVNIVARSSSFHFHTAPGAKPRSLWQRIRRPSSVIGPGYRSRFFSNFPWLFYHLPRGVRMRTVRTFLGPAAAYSVRDRVVGRVPIVLGYSTLRAEARNGKVHLSLSGRDGSKKEHVTEHVIAATGYRVDLRRLNFLSDVIQSELHKVENTPVLSRYFESSVPGLYFVGVAAANSFGPVLRFACGADFTARQITKRLRKSAKQTLPRISVDADKHSEVMA